MSDSQPHEALFLPFGDHFEFNNAGDVVRIHLKYNKNINYEGDNWRKVADAIVRSPALKDIAWKNHDRDDDSSNALAAVFGRERTHPCTLEEFSADDSCLGPKLALMLPFFKSTPEIKLFDFYQAGLRDEGTRLLSEVLNHTRIYNLNIHGNEISGEDLGRLFSAENSKHLHKLDLEYNDIGAHGQEAIFQFLERDDTQMRELYFNFVDQNQFRTVMESISSRSNMVALLAEEEVEDDDMDEEFVAAMSSMLKNVVCNTDTFEGLCESNHQLIWVGPYMRHMLNSDSVLKKAITINNQSEHGASIASRIRSKLRAFYFQGQFDVQPFINMDVALMSFALALVTRPQHIYSMDDNMGDGWSSEGDLGSVYHLVRNCHLPELVTFLSSESRI